MVKGNIQKIIEDAYAAKTSRRGEEKFQSVQSEISRLWIARLNKENDIWEKLCDLGFDVFSAAAWGIFSALFLAIFFYIALHLILTFQVYHSKVSIEYINRTIEVFSSILTHAFTTVTGYLIAFCKLFFKDGGKK